MRSTSTLKEEPKTISEQIEGLFEKYIDTTGAILDDYVADEGMITELTAADDHLKKEILALADEGEKDFDSLLEKIKEHDDFDPEKILELVDIDDVTDHFSGQGYICVKVDNINDADKIETFLKTEIYPFDADQRSNILL